jgi:hypothetical protein
LTTVICSGCGLVPIPYSRSLPGPVSSVRVVDAYTGDDITDAQVSATVWKYENWMRTFPPSISSKGDTTPPDLFLSQEQLQVTRQSDHIFQIQRIKRMACAKPWGIGPLGTTVYEDYGVNITAKASGFYPIFFSYYPMNLQGCLSDEGSRVSIQNDSLWLFEMRRIDSSHSSNGRTCIEPSQVIYHPRLNPESLTQRQLQMLTASVNQEMLTEKKVWFVRVLYNRNERLTTVIYFMPALVSKRIRKGEYVYYQYDPRLMAIAQQMGKELEPECHEYYQVSPKGKPFTIQASIPSLNSMLPFRVPKSFLEQEVVEIVDFIRSAPKEKSKTERGLVYFVSEVDQSLPIMTIRKEGEIIKVRTGTQEDGLAGSGQFLDIKKTEEGYELVEIGEWVS